MVDGQFLVSNIQMKVCRITEESFTVKQQSYQSAGSLSATKRRHVTADCVGGSPNAGDDISTEEVGRDRDDHPDQMRDHELPARTNPQGC